MKEESSNLGRADGAGNETHGHVMTAEPAGADRSTVKFHGGTDIPLELHKVRVVQKLYLHPIEERLRAIREADFGDSL